MPTPDPFRLALGARLRDIEALLGGQAPVCAVAGVARSTWARWLTGESDPGFEALAQLAAEAGVSLDWLATGRGERFRGGCPNHGRFENGTGPAVDEALMGRVAEGVATVYRQESARLSPGDLGRLSGRLLNDLQATYSDPQEREVGLRVLLTRLRQDLRQKPDSPEARKSSA